MKVPLLDLKAQYATIQNELEAATLKALRDTRYILGPDVGELECALAGFTGAKHVIGCASGSDALLLALMALEIGPGDEVITTPHTFFATAGAVVRLGAKLVFVDIDPRTYNIDVQSLKSKVSSRTKAIIPVHLFGQCADMDPILEFASQHNLAVIEDAAQAIGARYRSKVERRGSSAESEPRLSTLTPSPSTTPAWRQAGTMGTMGTFSFFPSKNLGGAGDGGAISTNDDALADKLRVLRVHGSKPKYYHSLVGTNSRLDTLQAAILNVKLPHLKSWTEGRQRNAAHYDKRFKELGIAAPSGTLNPPPSTLVLPYRDPHCDHIFNQYTIRVKPDHGPKTLDQGSQRRDALREYLTKREIGTEIYYPVPLHLQKCFASLGYQPGDFPVAEQAAKESVSLPIYPELTQEQIDYVASTIKEFFNRE